MRYLGWDDVVDGFFAGMFITAGLIGMVLTLFVVGALVYTVYAVMRSLSA